MAPTKALSLLLRGTLVDAPALTRPLRLRPHGVVGVADDGTILLVEADHAEHLAPGESSLVLHSGTTYALPPACRIVTAPNTGFVCPGLVDAHTHAPQFPNAGLGYDLELLEWLETYTFPKEARFESLAYAERVCTNAVRRTLASGTTTCVYFGTTHADAAVLLSRVARRRGQRALVGKVSMDRNAPDYYCETTQQSLDETARFVDALDADAAEASGAELLGPPARAVITPRFVPTCTPELMCGLARLAKERGLLVQSHVSENPGEVAWVRQLHPAEASYTAAYDSHGLLGGRTLLAHGIYLEAGERALMRARGAAVVHCPLSNSQLRSGMLNVRRLLDEGVRVALGTDVSGGASPSMLTAVREALKVSNMVSVYEGSADAPIAPLTYAEAFWLATAGGAQALGIDGLTATLEVGSVCDALVIDPEAAGSPFDVYEGETALETFQKWLQLGDDRNTAAVFVQGREVLPAPPRGNLG